MRRLMLLRHAEAARPDGIDDHDRPLTPHGHKQGAEMGRYLARQLPAPDLAIVSTAKRTQETWGLAFPNFHHEITQRNEPRIYEAGLNSLLEVVRETPSSAATLLLVGHNPGFEQLAKSLAGNGRPAALSRLQREYPTAGLAVIDFAIDDWTQAKEHSGYLERFESLSTISQ